MTQTPLFANIAILSALNVNTFLSSRFTVVSVPFKVNSYCHQNKPADLLLFLETCTWSRDWVREGREGRGVQTPRPGTIGADNGRQYCFVVGHLKLYHKHTLESIICVGSWLETTADKKTNFTDALWRWRKSIILLLFELTLLYYRSLLVLQQLIWAIEYEYSSLVWMSPL